MFSLKCLTGAEQAGTSDWSDYLLGDVAWEILKNGSRLDEMPPGSSNWILLPLVGGNRSSLYLSTFEGVFILCLASSPPGWCVLI